MATATRAGTGPPASAFAQLLRRSRFASFDSAIAQTYTAPPAYARRGNYGLKRSIPMPYKDSYISLAAFEHHAQFTEWNNASQQVKLVRCVEEMNVFPRYAPSGSDFSWEKGLGEARTQWFIDSEFSEHTYPVREVEVEEASVEGGGEEGVKPKVPEVQATNLDALGKQGPGAYGLRRPPAKGTKQAGNHPQPNIAAMSPKQFRRYLAKLRQLRPQFKAYLAEQQREQLWVQRQREIQTKLEAKAPAGATEETTSPTSVDIDDMPEVQQDSHALFVASQNLHQKFHRRFLSEHTAKDYSPPESTKIEKQPHQNGGLLYSHPSALDSALRTSPQPGLVLQTVPRLGSFFNDKAQQDYVALFGGITALLRHRNAGSAMPLYDPELENPLATRSDNGDGTLDNHKASLRMTQLKVISPPRVVSLTAARMPSKEMLGTVSLVAECATDLPWSQRNLSNPYRPGSYEYAIFQPSKQVRFKLLQHRSVADTSYGSVLSHFGKFQKKDAENNARKALRLTRSTVVGGQVNERRLSENVMKTLSSIVKPESRGLRDEDL